MQAMVSGAEQRTHNDCEVQRRIAILPLDSDVAALRQVLGHDLEAERGDLFLLGQGRSDQHGGRKGSAEAAGEPEHRER